MLSNAPQLVVLREYGLSLKGLSDTEMKLVIECAFTAALRHMAIIV